MSTDRGDSWSPVNTGLTSGMVNSLAVRKSAVFAGTYGGGMFQSSNQAQSWNEFSSGLETMDVYSILIGDTQVLAGTSGRGVWKNRSK